MGAYMTYLLVPEGETSTRLLLKVAVRTNPVLARFLRLGDLVMARKQLLTLRELAQA